MKSPQTRLGDRVVSIAYEDGAPLDRQSSKGRFGRLGSLPMSREHEARSSKFRRHGSKLMSVLRSFTNSGKWSVPRPAESSAKSSLDSKPSTKSKGVTQNSTENRKIVAKQTAAEGDTNEKLLTPIAEVESCEATIPSE
jgi:hypothetical protein